MKEVDRGEELMLEKLQPDVCSSNRDGLIPEKVQTLHELIAGLGMFLFSHV